MAFQVPLFPQAADIDPAGDIPDEITLMPRHTSEY